MTAVQAAQAGEDDVNTHAERRADAKRGACHGHKVDPVTEEAVDDVAKQREERVAHRHGQVPAVGRGHTERDKYKYSSQS